MPEPKLQEWQVPPAAADPSRKLIWINEHCEDGTAWQRTQRGYGDWKKAFDILSGRPDPLLVPTYRSQLSTGRLKRNVKEVVGAVSNIRPIWAYNSDNPAFQAQCNMMNKVTRAIYLENHLDLGIKKTMQWAAATCTGWLRPVYRRKMYGTGEGSIDFLSYGAASVIPTQLPSNNDWQEAYAVTLLDELPIAMAHGMFPDFQDELRPTRSQFWYSADIRKAAKGNMFQRMWNKWGRGEGQSLTDLYVPIRYTTIIDLAVNRTGSPIKMGPWSINPDTERPEPAASWSYEVPSVGQDIPEGRAKDGRILYKKATENDARMYPHRRLMISSEQVLMYDGPSFNWHGELDLIPFQLDDWAWEAIGFSIIRDGYNIQQATNEIDRGTMDKIRAGLDMGLAYDINAVTRNEATQIDPMQPRARAGFDGSLTSEPFKPLVPTEVLRIDPASLEFRSILEQTGDYQLAINSIMALAKARAAGGDMDALQKLMEADGPIVRDISRNVERGLAQVGNQTKFLTLQFETAQRIMQWVGPDGMTKQTFDYDPNSLIPSHMPDEYLISRRVSTEGKDEGVEFKSPERGSAFTKLQRAKFFAQNLRYFILPHSAHEIAQMSHKLGLIQLRKAGVQIDSQTIAEAWNVDLGANFKGTTPYQRFWEEQEDAAEHAIHIKMIVDQITAAGVEPTPALIGALDAVMGPSGEGRPPTGLQPPQVVAKDGGARSTISQSGS